MDGKIGEIPIVRMHAATETVSVATSSTSAESHYLCIANTISVFLLLNEN